MYTNMLYNASRYSGTNPEIAIPTGWTIARGTANSPALTGWSSTWDATGGVTSGWNTTYSTSAEFPNSPVGYAVDFTGTSWDNGTRNAAFDDGSAGDLDGVANKMGGDARITVPAGTAPGTYYITVLGIGHDSGNGKAHVEQTITITVPDTTAPTVTAFTMPATASSLTVNVTSFTATDTGGVTGYKITESATAPLPGDAGWTSTAPSTFTFSGSGTKTAYAWAKDAAGNVSTSRSATVTIALKQDQTITFGTLPTKTYGDGDFAPGATASSGLTVTYASSNTSVATIVGSAIHIVGAGTANITASQAGNATYNPAPDVVQALTVNRANQTITFGALSSRTYGDGDVAPGATASSSLTVTYASSNTSVATIVGGQIHIVGAGTTTITASQSGNTNYDAATDVQQPLTVNQASQTIAFGALTARTYGDADFAPGATATSSLTVSYASSNTSVATIVGGQIQIVGVGSTTITASQSGNTNYAAAADVQQPLSVGVKTLTVTAEAKSKIYGAVDPALTYTSSGLVGGDTISGSLARAAGETVGNYAINQGTLSAGSNYTITYTGANLGINAAGLAVNAEAKSKSYGAADPALTYTATGFVNGDTVAVMTGALTRAAGENAGNYAINQGTLSAGSNYTITYTGANLGINAAALTVRADDQTKAQGAPNPALTVSYSGFVNGDTAASLTTQPTATTTAIDSSPAGTYPITASGGVSSNYTFTYVDGTLTVTGAANHTLGVTTAGTGVGSVNSTPTGIACTSGSGNGCSATYGNGTPVTLLATPDWKSLFIGWSGACTGTGDCNVTLTADATVTATFDVKPLVKQPGTPPTYFATIQDAYGQAADGTTLYLTNIAFTEDLTFNRPVTISLVGGYDETYSTRSGMTTLHGTLVISDGGVNIDGLEVMQ